MPPGGTAQRSPGRFPGEPFPSRPDGRRRATGHIRPHSACCPVQDLGDTVLGHPPHASSALDQPRGLSVAYTVLTTRPGARQADRSPTRLRRSRCKTHITAVRPLGFAVRDSRRLRFNTLSATVYHRSFACIGRYTPPQPPPTTTLLWRRRSYASSLRARRHWHDTRREDYEQRPESVPAVRGRSPRSRGVRAVGVVGAQLRCLE
jgi:hypothetical protein